MTIQLKNPPVILVTGGDSGIGLAIAGKFTQEGYRVAIRGLDRRAGTRALASLASSKHEAAYFVADIRKEKQIEKLMRQTVQRFAASMSCATTPLFRSSRRSKKPRRRFGTT
jgi:NAD(P)-dependent dehydrogenase (short-subunit alcohol dehydrogenase family)